MRILYDTGVVGKELAEERYWQLVSATRKSKLNIKWTLEKEDGVWKSYAETKLPVFDAWTDFNDYIKKLVVNANITWHNPKGAANE